MTAEQQAADAAISEQLLREAFPDYVEPAAVIADAVANAPVAQELLSQPAAEFTPPAAVPTQGDEINRYRAEVAARDAQLQRYEQMFLQSQQAVQPQAPAAPAPEQFFDATKHSLTADELAAYGDNLPVLDKVNRQVINDYHQKTVMPLVQELARLRQESEAVKQEATILRTTAVSAGQRAFDASLAAVVPDLMKNPQDPAWQSFLKTTHDFMGRPVSINDELGRRYQDGDIKGIEQIWKKFKSTTTPPAAAPAPGRSGVLADLPVSGATRFNEEKYEELNSKYRKGLVSQDVYNKAQAAAFDAMFA